VLLLIAAIQAQSLPFQQPAAVAALPGREWLGADGQTLPFRTDDEVLEFLRTATVVSERKIGEGITGSHLLLLERGGIRMHAIYRTFRERRQTVLPSGRKIEIRDEYRFEPAAYVLSRLLGLENVPPAILRTIGDRPGSLQIWIENSMTEKVRLRNRTRVPNDARILLEVQIMTVFDNLIYNSDRHGGNILYDRYWNLWMVDHTRAFHVSDELLNPAGIHGCEANLWRSLKSLDRDQVRERLSQYLEPDEMDALLNRLDSLVEHIQEQIDEEGSARVLFVIPR
jgi:hypothetical protein